MNSNRRARNSGTGRREISVDPEMYANRLVEDEYRKFARIALEAAVNAASNREEN